VRHHRFLNLEKAPATIFAYIELFYNDQLAHATLRFLSPVDYETNASVFK
jgi:hypothetical protein